MAYQRQVDEIVSKAQFGDLIEFAYPIGYSHWGVYDGDGYVIHFSVADESQLMSNIRNCLQTALPMSGDILLGETKIRRQRLAEVNVPIGARITINNSDHFPRASTEREMRRRRDALLNKVLPYRIHNLNCEHFASYVRYGRAVCNQIPAIPKNKECEEATKVFQDIVS